jgi:hypothetical protein
MADQNDTELIYHRYLQAFKKGVYNYIKEEADSISQQMIPRKYFSGGLTLRMDAAMVITETISPAQLSKENLMDIVINLSIDKAVLVPTEKDYKTFFPYYQGMSFGRFKYDLALHELVKDRDRGKVLYIASGVDIPHVLLTTNGEEFDMVDKFVPNFEEVNKYFENNWNNKLLDGEVDQYIREKRENGFASVMDIRSKFNLTLIAELKALSITKEQISIKPLEQGFSLSFEKKFPGENQSKKYTFNFIGQDVTEFKPTKKYDVFYQKAGMDEKFNDLSFDSLLPKYDSYMNNGAFMILNTYNSRRTPLEKDLSRIFKSMVHYKEVVFPDSLKNLEDVDIRDLPGINDVDSGYGLKMKIYRKNDAAMSTVLFENKVDMTDIDLMNVNNRVKKRGELVRGVTLQWTAKPSESSIKENEELINELVARRSQWSKDAGREVTRDLLRNEIINRPFMFALDEIEKNAFDAYAKKGSTGTVLLKVQESENYYKDH